MEEEGWDSVVEGLVVLEEGLEDQEVPVRITR